MLNITVVKPVGKSMFDLIYHDQVAQNRNGGAINIHCLPLTKDFITWMNQNIGKRNRKWRYNGIITISEYNEGISFSFNNEDEAMAFKLRWL